MLNISTPKDFSIISWSMYLTQTSYHAGIAIGLDNTNARVFGLTTFGIRGPRLPICVIYILPIISELGQHLSNLLRENVVKNERHIMTTDKQLELGFNGLQIRAAGPRREGRVARANWWFARMRAIVENAMDWSTAAAPPPEQIWMPGASREMKV
jgi:hypothetical protein